MTEVDIAPGAGEQQPAESRPHEMVLTLSVGAEAVLLDDRGVDADAPVGARVPAPLLQLAS